jgi:hypothetical protein
VRRPVDEELIHTFFRSFGAEAKTDALVYVTGGVTAVLFGWRQSTVDLDIRMIPEQDSLFRAIPKLKESLSVNVELASRASCLSCPDGRKGANSSRAKGFSLSTITTSIRKHFPK